MRRAAVAAGALALVLGACTQDDDDPAASGPTTPLASATPTAPPPWSFDDVRVDDVAEDPPRGRTDLPRRFPADDAELPDLLADPPGRAVLAYHPREYFDNATGWESERVFLLGVDGRWRSLDLVDLGLPQDAWPGSDTYGAGYLSYDGRQWAGRTGHGVVLVDLASGQARHVALPGKYSQWAAWRPDGRRLAMVRFNRDSTYWTWLVDPRTERFTRAPYLLPFGGYEEDGTVVTFRKEDGGTVRLTHRDGERPPTRESVPVPHKLVRNGVRGGRAYALVGLRRSSLAVAIDSMSPVARLEAGVFPLTWLDEDRVLLSLGRLGLVTWDVGTGAVEVVTRVRPASGTGRWWTASVAAGLVR